MQAADAHRRVDAGEPQSIPDPNFAGERRPGDHQPRPFDGKGAIQRQAKTPLLWMGALRKLQQMAAQFGNTDVFHRRGGEESGGVKAQFAQGLLDLRLNLRHPGGRHAVRLGEGHRQRRLSGQLQDRQVFAGLRHHAVIAGHHQQRMVDPSHPRQHVGQKLFVPGHVNKPQHPPVRLRPVGIAEIDRHSPRFLFRQTIGIYAGYRLQQRRFAVVNMSSGGNNHRNNISINRVSSSRQRRSSQSRPS